MELNNMTHKRHSTSHSSSTSFSSSLSDDELAITIKSRNNNKKNKKIRYHRNNNKSRLTDDSGSDNDDDDDFISSEDDLMGDLNINGDIRSNIAMLKRKSLFHTKLEIERPTLQQRSYSASHVNNNNDDDDISELNDEEIYNKYVLMKKKYKKQRRISKQFEEAITSIQDDNEDVLNQTEETIRNEYENEYEMKLIKLEHEKLNNHIEIDEKMKLLISQNEQLMNANKQLQHQVASQVSTIQQQQQFAMQQKEMMQRQLSGIGSVCTARSPLAACGNVVSAHSYRSCSVTPGLSSSGSGGSGGGSAGSIHTLSSQRRISCDRESCVNTSNIIINNDDNESLQLSLTSHIDEDCNFITYNHIQSTQDTNTNYIDHNDDDDDNEIHHNNHNNNNYLSPLQLNNKPHPININLNKINMEPHPYKYKNHHHKNKQIFKSNIVRGKRKKLDDLEKKLMEKDEEIKKKIGDGLTPWDRFWNLMTPDFCSCSPPTYTTKSINE